MKAMWKTPLGTRRAAIGAGLALALTASWQAWSARARDAAA